MPNINEFFDKKEIIQQSALEEIVGTKPCHKCEKNAEKAFWDPSTFTLSWTCPDGHSSQHLVNR